MHCVYVVATDDTKQVAVDIVAQVVVRQDIRCAGYIHVVLLLEPVVEEVHRRVELQEQVSTARRMSVAGSIYSDVANDTDSLLVRVLVPVVSLSDRDALIVKTFGGNPFPDLPCCCVHDEVVGAAPQVEMSPVLMYDVYWDR